MKNIINELISGMLNNVFFKAIYNFGCFIVLSCVVAAIIFIIYTIIKKIKKDK